jgi:general secretion pathway protein G
MQKVLKRNGFTLVEVIVVAGIIAVLAGILVPLIFKEIDESKITRAQADMKSISTSILVYKKDTGQWPTWDNTCAPVNTYLQSAGAGATGWPGPNWAPGPGEDFDTYFQADNSGCFGNKWKGPYMAVVSSDPWGHRYYLNTAAFSVPTGPVWLVSPGPNGQFETDANSTTLGGDDIGLRIR